METGWHAEDDLPCIINDWSGEQNEHLRRCTAHMIPEASPHTSATDWQNSAVNNPIPQHASHTTLVHHIGMSRNEVPVHTLVFDKDAFATATSEPDESETEREKEKIRSRLQMIQDEIDDYSTPPTLKLPRKKLSTFITSFHCKKELPKDPARVRRVSQPSGVINKAITRFLKPDSSKIWKAVYHGRLEINFHAARIWFSKALGMYLPSDAELIKRMSDRLENCLLLYIFFVDMILTTIAPEAVVNRSHSFHTAVDCFEKHFPQTLSKLKREFMLDDSSKKIAFVYDQLSNWMASDETYRTSVVLTDSQITSFWKAYFSFVFSYSIDDLTNSKRIEVLKNI
jgi:hypothetical protein